MVSYLGVAEDQGITQTEIGATEAIVMAVSAGRVRAQVHEATTISTRDETKNCRTPPT